MAAGGGFYSVAAYAAGLVLFGLICVGWATRRFNLKYRNMVFRITTSQAESIATEVQRMMAGLKLPMQHFRVSMAGTNSIVEFESDVSHSQQEKILTQLNRQGVITEVIPLESRHE